MKKILYTIAFVLVGMAAQAQTLNVTVGNVTDQYPASQTGEMTFTAGTQMTIMGKTYDISQIGKMWTDDTAVKDNEVNVVYSGDAALVYVAGNIAQYVTATVSGAHVSITQSDAITNDLINDGTYSEITYNLSGTSTDGSLTLGGSAKCTVAVNGLELTNPNGAPVNITNGKRVDFSIKKGTTNTLKDGTASTAKASLYCKGHLELKGKGVLNIYAYGSAAHGIKCGDYMEMKNCTVNILSATKDGVSCNEYFLMESGELTISGTGDDGIQCDLDGETSTDETDGHEDEDTGNIYLEGGTMNITVTAAAAKGIKADGDMKISNGDITVKTTGGGAWDSDDKKTKASSCLSADGNTLISGGTLSLTSTGAGGKGINGDGTLTATGGTVVIKTSGNAVVASSSGTISTISSSQQLDRYDSDYKSSPKGIKVDGAITISDEAVISVTTTGAGGEGIESKTDISITGGQVTVNTSDDAINASYNDETKGTNGAGDLTISGGMVYARSTGNDGIDANGNVYIKGGLVYAIGTSSPEVAIDANSEEQKKLYVTGGTIIAIGGLESGASLTQSCYSTSSWSKSTWYAMTVGNDTFAFKTPTSGGSTMVISGASQPTLKSGVTVSGGTSIFDGVGYTGATYTGGSSVNLSSYTSSGGGPGGGGPGGGGGRP